MRSVSSILLLGLLCLVSRAAAGDYQAGKYDEIALRELRATMAVAPLKTVTLHEVAPEYVVEKHEGLTWEEALAEANQRFGEKQPERALFLRKYLAAGAPKSRVDELRWPPGPTFVSGETTLTPLYWYGPEIHAKLRVVRDQNGGDWSKGRTVGLLETKPLAQIDVGIVHGVLTDIPSLSFAGVKFKDFTFVMLSFDGDDRLAHVWREIPIEGTGATMQIIYQGGSSAYSVSIKDRDQNWESLNYGADLVLLTRWVQSRERMLFHEIYENGRLRKRVHTDGPPQVDEKGRYVEKAEVFP